MFEDDTGIGQRCIKGENDVTADGSGKRGKSSQDNAQNNQIVFQLLLKNAEHY